MTHPIAHIEIAGRDGETLEKFYSQLFGWEIERRETGGFPYGFIKAVGKSELTGGIRHEPQGKAEIVFYVEVPELAATIAAAQSLGAAIRIPPMAITEVTFALLTDPEGNPIGLIQKK